MPKKPVYLIAEMACSHEGDPAHARTIIDAAGQAGADAIQFQIWSVADMVVPHHPNYDFLKGIELAYDQWDALAQYVRTHYPQMEIIACVYERPSADFAERMGADAYKIHASDLTNPHLIRHVAATGKRIDLSVGCATVDEIRDALDWIGDATETWLMYGYQNFPTRTDDVHLDYMMKLRELFELPMGYQDHSDADTEAAFWLPAAALGLGVEVLEKHITHDRSFKGVDHEAALNPDEFARFADMIREIDAARGVSVPKAFSADEAKYRRYAKKSLVAARDLPAGHCIQPEDLRWMRTPTLGLPPSQLDALVGQVTTAPIDAFALVTEDTLAAAAPVSRAA